MRKKYGDYTRKQAIILVKYEFGLTTKEAVKYLTDCNGNYSILRYIEDGIKHDAHATFYECDKRYM